MPASQQTITLVELSPLLEEVNKKVKRLESESEKLQQQWRWLSDAAKGSQTGLTGWALGLTGVGRSVQSVGLTFSNSLQAGFLNAKKLEGQLASTIAKLGQLGRKAAEIAAEPAAATAADLADQQNRLKAINDQMAGLTAKSDRLKAIVPYYHAQNEFLEKLKSVNVKFVALEGFLAGVGLKKALEYNRQLNESLVYSNSVYSNRQELMTEILKVQGMTGNSTEDMAAAVKSLAGYGLEADKNFGGILRTSVLLEEGLGLSYEASAQLAEVWERRLHTSVKDAGDLIARVVDQTSLASGKAAEFATNLGRAFANVGMTGKGINDAVERVVKLEGFINRQGGKAGEISKLVAKMQTVGGAGQAAMLGINRPGQLASDAGAKQATDELARQVKSVTNSTQAGTLERAAMLEQLSDRYETSTETLLALSKAVDDNNQANDKTMNLEERWRNQVANTSKGVELFLGSMQSLLHQGFLPFLKAINWASNGLAKMIGWFAEFRVAGWLAVGAVGVAMTVAGYKAYSLVKSLVTLAGALHLAAIKAREAAVANAVGSIPTGPAGKAGGIGRVLGAISDWNNRMGRQGARMAGEGATRLDIFKKTLVEVAKSARAGAGSAVSVIRSSAGSLWRMPVGAVGTAAAGTGATGVSSLFGVAGSVTVGGIATVAAAVLGVAAVSVAAGLLLNKYVFKTYDKPKPAAETLEQKQKRAFGDAIAKAAAGGQTSEIKRLTELRQAQMKKSGMSAAEQYRENRIFEEQIKNGNEVRAARAQRENVKDPRIVESLKANAAIAEGLKSMSDQASSQARAQREVDTALAKAKDKRDAERQKLLEEERLHALGAMMATW